MKQYFPFLWGNLYLTDFLLYFFMTAYVYFIGLFSSNIQYLLQHLLLSLIWYSLVQQKQQIAKIRCWRTSKWLRPLMSAKLAPCSAATSPFSMHHCTSMMIEVQHWWGSSWSQAGSVRADCKRRAEPMWCPLPSAIAKFSWAQYWDLSCSSCSHPLPPIICVLQGFSSDMEAYRNHLGGKQHSRSLGFSKPTKNAEMSISPTHFKKKERKKRKNNLNNLQSFFSPLLPF